MLILGGIRLSGDEEMRKILKSNFPVDVIPFSEFFLFEGEHPKREEAILKIKSRMIEVFTPIMPFLEQYIKYMNTKTKGNESFILSMVLKYPLLQEEEDVPDEECVFSYLSPEIKIDENFISSIKMKSFKDSGRLDTFIDEIVSDMLLYKELVVDAPNSVDMEEISRKDYIDFYLSPAEREVLEWI